LLHHPCSMATSPAAAAAQSVMFCCSFS